MTTPTDSHEIFTPEKLAALLPPERADEFFEALYGDASEGAYDISLALVENSGRSLIFELRLSQRPDRCLACNLTFGLPQVFMRHPVLNLKGLVAEIAAGLGLSQDQLSWRLGPTRVISDELHAVPILIELS